jgi:hypothetical protein
VMLASGASRKKAAMSANRRAVCFIIELLPDVDH